MGNLNKKGKMRVVSLVLPLLLAVGYFMSGAVANEESHVNAMAEEMIQAELGESNSAEPVTLTGCYDREEPELCFHKASLCVDPHHKDKIRYGCPATCGVCKSGDAKVCSDNTAICSQFQKECDSPNGIVKSICKLTCQNCF